MREALALKFVEEQVGDEKERFEKKIRSIAAVARMNLVVPFCDKHQLRLEIGDLRFAFIDKDGEWVSEPWDGIRGPSDKCEAPEDYALISRVLHLTVTSNKTLRHYMEPYTPSTFPQG